MKLTATDSLAVLEGVKAFEIIASPNGLVYDPDTGAMDQDSFAVEIWHTDSDEGKRTHVYDLSDYNLTLEATAGGVEADTGAETKTTEVGYEEGSSGQLLYFGDLLEEFNMVLVENGKNAVKASMNVFDYLVEAYSAVINEYEDQDSPLFAKSTYEEVYDYHGSVTTYETVAVNAMTSWIMAMCLAEIVPTSGTTTNVQTKLFAKAFELGGGSSVPLFGNFTLRADPWFTRTVAGLVYAKVKHGKSFATINVFRNELGGSSINASNWDGLGYTHTEQLSNNVRKGFSMNNLGYLVNADLFLPSAPGPRISGSNAAAKPLPSEQGQSASLFDSDNNYSVDASANASIVANYRLSKKLARSTWNGYSDAKKNWLIQAAALTRCTVRYMFSGRINVALKNGNDGTQYVFSASGADTGMYIEGPFSILAGKNLYPYISQTTDAAIENAKTPVQKFMDKVLTVADNSRWPTFDPNYGRRRPCGPTSGLAGGTYSSEVGHEQNEIYNISLALMVADNQQQYDKWNAQDQENHAGERPNSYPSGHSAQIWTMAMLLGQMDPEHLPTFTAGAYKYSVGRTVGRCHWTSDIIYGRLFGTMILPIINAMNGSGWQAGYDAMKNAVLNGVNYSDDMQVNIVLINNSGKSIPVTGEIKLYFPALDGNGNDSFVAMLNSTIGYPYCGTYTTLPPGTTQVNGCKCIKTNAGHPVEYVGRALQQVKVYVPDPQYCHNSDLVSASSSGTLSNGCTFNITISNYNT